MNYDDEEYFRYKKNYLAALRQMRDDAIAGGPEKEDAFRNALEDLDDD